MYKILRAAVAAVPCGSVVYGEIRSWFVDPNFKLENWLPPFATLRYGKPIRILRSQRPFDSLRAPGTLRSAPGTRDPSLRSGHQGQNEKVVVGYGEILALHLVPGTRVTPLRFVQDDELAQGYPFR